jgi:hypothetical protein
MLFFVGAPPPPMYYFPPEQEDTPRTYRSDISGVEPPKVQPKNTDNVILSSKVTLEYLKKSFSFFNRAIVSLISHALKCISNLKES